MSKLYHCTSCNTYTLKEQCSTCLNRTVTPGPARYSPEDKYASYRRRYKKLHGI